MIDAKRYVRLKPKGVVSIEDSEDGCYLVFKRFSVEDASEIPPEKQLIEMDKIQIKRDELQAELEAFNQFIEDVSKE